MRFSIVTSGRGQSKADDFDNICKALKRIKEEVGIEVCCSLGILTEEQAFKLKELGVTRYHSNLETAPSHFPDICSTHTYEDKMFTIHNAQKQACVFAAAVFRAERNAGAACGNGV